MKCLAQMSSVLSRGMHFPNGNAASVGPQAAPPFPRSHSTAQTAGPPVTSSQSAEKDHDTMKMTAAEDLPQA